MYRARFLLPAWLILFLAGCASLNGLSGSVTAETEETQSVIVPGIPSLSINHFAGDVTIRDGEAGKITAHLTRMSRLDDAAEAQAQLDLITMTFTQSGTNVTLSVEGADKVEDLVNAPAAILEVLVPPGTVLDVDQGAGDLTVEQPGGDVTVNLGAGNATVTLPADASFHLKVTGGVATVNSEFENVPTGGPATDIDTTIGSNPTQTLSFNLGAGDVNLNKAP